MQTNDDGSLTFTRDQLHDLVWTKPVIRLAREFGLSDRGLAKACERFKIPRPGRGYWARLQHGQPARRVPLPKLEGDAPVEITITPEPHQKIGRPQLADEPPAIPIPEVLADPHPMVVRTADSLRAAKPDKEGLAGPRAKQTLNVRVSPPCIDRATRICDALIKALQARGWSVRVEDPKEKERAPDRHYGYGHPPKPEMTPRRMFAVVDGEDVEFSVYERVARERRELTPAEIKRKETNWREFRHPQWTYTPTGHLYIEIATTTRDHRGPHKWFDRGKHQTLDRRLAEFIAKATELAAAIKRERAAAEEARRQHEAWLRERDEKLAAIREEDERLKHLMAEVDAWHGSQRIRAYIEAVRKYLVAKHGTEIEPGSEAAEWIAWATAQADRPDPLVSPRPPSILDERKKWEAWP